MNIYEERRSRVLSQLAFGEMMVLYSGESVPCSMDEGYAFEANHHFFYLTGLRRENMALVITNTHRPAHVVLFIEEPIPTMERWTGRRVTIEEAQKISGIQDVRYIDSLNAFVGRCVARETVNTAYFDCYRNAVGDADMYNMTKAKAFMAQYPTITLKNAHQLVSAMRMVKDDAEVATLERAIAVTDQGLRRVLATLEPGRMEYQEQAEFEYEIRMQGAEGVSFPTIAGSGINGCMLHYGTNHCKLEDGKLLLLDLGARVDGYCADITRTYPINGKYTPRQREIYDIVLRANREVAKTARPGVTLRELNELCKKVLAEGLMAIGKIESADQIGTYYMHGVSHHLGIDTHDCAVNESEGLRAGMVISDEPGLYIDEEEIGIRIEDDLLITEDGCRVLSEAIPREAEEIEALMAR
mgnify:FL=1